MLFDWTAEFSCSSIELRSYHAMHWSCVHVLAALACVQLRATQYTHGDQRRPMGPWGCGRTLLCLLHGAAEVSCGRLHLFVTDVRGAPCELGSIVEYRPCFLAECRKRRLNRGSFVCCLFALFAFSGLFVICVLSVFLICLLSCIFWCEPTWMALYSLVVLMYRSLTHWLN